MRKGRTTDDVDQIIQWLTGYDSDGLKAVLERCLDKLIDELAKGKSLEKIFRK